MTNAEKAILSAYTGILMGDFDLMHRYIEYKMGRQVFTHELGNKSVQDEIHKRVRPDFIDVMKGKYDSKVWED